MGSRVSSLAAEAVVDTLGRAHPIREHDAARDAAPADTVELLRILAATQLRFGAALRELDRLQRLNALREHENALLREAMVKARRFAYHDELTGLPNRHLLLDRFNQAVALAARHDQVVALLFFDLDRFKEVNDALGHAAGDKLLKRVAERLATCIRASDTACRYGGDEFVVLLPELRDKESAVVAANHIRAQLAAPYSMDGVELTITTSLGIAVHAVDAPHEYRDLLRIADAAMYRDKAQLPRAPTIARAALDVA